MSDPYKAERLLQRALFILHEMSLERTGWRGWFRRWYFSHEPLRHDAANILRESGHGFLQPDKTRRVGDRP